MIRRVILFVSQVFLPQNRPEDAKTVTKLNLLGKLSILLLAGQKYFH
jgi:hypothetical protein